METPMGKHHHISPDNPPSLLERKPVRQLVGLSENESSNLFPLFESQVFSPADGTTTPKGKGHQLPPMPYTSPPSPSRQRRIEVGLINPTPPVFSPVGVGYPRSEESRVHCPSACYSNSLERQPARPCRKRVSAQNNDSPATIPRYMDWSFCRSNDSRPLHTLPFFTGMAPRYFR